MHPPHPGPSGQAGAGPHLPSSLIHSNSLLWCAWGYQPWSLVALHQAELEGEGESRELGLSLLPSAELYCLPHPAYPAGTAAHSSPLSLPHVPGPLQLPACGHVSLPPEPSHRGATNQLTAHGTHQQMPEAVHVSTLAGHQPPALPATASRRRFSQEHGKARSLAPGLTSAPATPIRGSEVICFLSPMQRRTGPSPEPALQVQQRQAAPPHGTGGSGEALLPIAQTGLAAATGAAVSGSPPTPAQKHGVRAFPASETSPGAGHAARWHPVAPCGINAPVPSFPWKP